MFVLNIHKLMLINDPSGYGLHPSFVGGQVVPPLSLRAHSFLDDPRTSREIRASVVDVQVRGERPMLPARLGCSAPHSRWCEKPNLHLPAHPEDPPFEEDKAWMQRGSSNAQVIQQLGSGTVGAARVLRLSDTEGAFSG
ncbi:MAG: hypothetical protein SGPRY_009958 [Prymnesium sp.]